MVCLINGTGKIYPSRRDQSWTVALIIHENKFQGD